MRLPGRSWIQWNAQVNQEAPEPLSGQPPWPRRIVAARVIRGADEALEYNEGRVARSEGRVAKRLGRWISSQWGSSGA